MAGLEPGHLDMHRHRLDRPMRAAEELGRLVTPEGDAHGAGDVDGRESRAPTQPPP